MTKIDKKRIIEEIEMIIECKSCECSQCDLLKPTKRMVGVIEESGGPGSGCRAYHFLHTYCAKCARILSRGIPLKELLETLKA